MTYTIQLDWKEFNISLPNLQTHLKSEFGDAFVGISANSKLELHFSEQISDEDKAAIEEHYELLDGSDYVSIEDLKAQADELIAAIAALKTLLIAKSWDEMTAVERKVAMNMEVTRAEMGLE